MIKFYENRIAEINNSIKNTSRKTKTELKLIEFIKTTLHLNERLLKWELNNENRRTKEIRTELR